jgi:hypothetical protein
MLRVRDFISDNHMRVGIVVERVERPTTAWIRDQKDQRVRDLSDDEAWWRVLPLEGGSVLVPDSLATRMREATYGDVMKAIESGNDHAARELAFVFPEILDAAHRLRAEKNG